MLDHQKTLTQIKTQTTTHSCPNCQDLTYCAMEDGKSANLCWCMTVEKVELPTASMSGSNCLCKNCLTNQA